MACDTKAAAMAAGAITWNEEISVGNRAVARLLQPTVDLFGADRDRFAFHTLFLSVGQGLKSDPHPIRHSHTEHKLGTRLC